MLKSKNQKMILFLLNSDKYVSLSNMAKRFGVSERALRYHVDEMGDFLKNYGVTLEHKAGKGIRLNLPIGCNSAKLAHQIESLTVQDLILDNDEKKSYIISRLMMLRNPITIQKLADEIYVGRNTIAALLDEVESWFKQFGIKMLRKTNYGLKLNYTHKNWRDALAALLSNSGKTIWFYEIADKNDVQKFIRSNQNGTAFFVSDFEASRTAEEIESFHDIITDMEQKKGCHLSDLEYSAYVFQLKLILERAKNGDRFILSDDYIDVITSLPSYSRAKMLVEQMNHRFDVRIMQEEAAYLALQIFSIEHAMKKNLHDQRILAIAEKMIDSVLEKTSIEEKHFQHLLQCLSININYAVKSCQTNKYVFNPMFRTLVKEHGELFNKIEECCKLINDTFNVELRNDEIALLASTFLIQYHKDDETDRRNRIHVLLVCFSGVGTSRMLSSRLNAVFPNLDIIGFSALNDLTNCPELHLTDLIISTVPIKKNMGIPAITVSPMLDDASIELISYFMNVKRMYDMNKNDPKQVTIDLICSIIDKYAQKSYNKETVRSELELLLDFWNKD